jgi:hypothetical protein
MSIAWLAVAARAATPGFVEDFTTGTGGFGGGSTVLQVTSGGVGGTGDPYLEVSNAFPSRLGTFSQAPDLTGDLPADGVTGYSFWLRDTGADDALEIHVGVGIPFSNFWQSLQGFTPPDGTWQQFSVDLTDSSQWIQIIGSGSFADALAGSTNLLFRHDLAPYMQEPDMVAADFGLDRIQVLPAPAPLPAVSASGRVALGLVLLTVAGAGIRRSRRTLPLIRV